MSDVQSLVGLIVAELAAIVAEKGDRLPEIGPASVLLGAGLPVDSLDLATLLVVLEQKLKVDPFRRGLRLFTTVGELADLYAAELREIPS